MPIVWETFLEVGDAPVDENATVPVDCRDAALKAFHILLEGAYTIECSIT